MGHGLMRKTEHNHISSDMATYQCVVADPHSRCPTSVPQQLAELAGSELRWWCRCPSCCASTTVDRDLRRHYRERHPAVQDEPYDVSTYANSRHVLGTAYTPGILGTTASTLDEARARITAAAAVMIQPQPRPQVQPVFPPAQAPVPVSLFTNAAPPTHTLVPVVGAFIALPNALPLLSTTAQANAPPVGRATAQETIDLTSKHASGVKSTSLPALRSQEIDVATAREQATKTEQVQQYDALDEEREEYEVE